MDVLELARMASEEVACVCGFKDVVGTKVILAQGRRGGCADAEPVCSRVVGCLSHHLLRTALLSYTCPIHIAVLMRSWCVCVALAVSQIEMAKATRFIHGHAPNTYLLSGTPSIYGNALCIQTIPANLTIR
jgi:hypothetical protein